MESVVLVETDSLGKMYGDFHALRDCSMSVIEGEVFGILGPNGAGKSTLIRLLLGFLKPTSGSASIMDIDCAMRAVDVHKKVAYLPAEARLFPSMRGRDALRFFCRIRRIKDAKEAFEIADRLQLDVRRRVSAMSTGMRQKLALAATLSAQTPIVILDEPTANLDPTVRNEVMQLVTEARQSGKTVIFSSHVLPEVEETCDRIIVLKAGELVHTQTMTDLRRQHVVRVRLNEIHASLPEELFEVQSFGGGNDETVLSVKGPLHDALKWLASLQLTEVRVESVGLRAIYDRFHPRTSHNSTSDEMVEA